jgi:hypothetical protein
MMSAHGSEKARPTGSRTTRSLAALVCILVLVSPASATIFNHTVEPLPGETFTLADFSLWLPEFAPPIRGVYFTIFPRLSDSRPQVSDAVLQQLCTEADFAILGARLADVGMETGIGDAVLRSLAVFAAASDHPELAHAPLFLEGYSWGGQFGYHFTVWRPQRVLGFITQKGGYHRTDPAGEAILVPGYLFIGAEDLPYRIENLTGIFEAHRPLGARWALAVQPGGGHERITDRDLLDPFFHTVTSLRLPTVLPPDQPPVLQIIPESSGWLGDRQQFLIGSWQCYDAAPDSASWLPKRDLAQAWQAFVSAGTVTDTIACPIAVPPHVPPAAGILASYPNPFNPATTIVYELASSGPATLRIYDLGGRLVRTLRADALAAAGRHVAVWDGRDEAGRVLAAGCYVCRLRAGSSVDSHRLILVR